MIGYLDTSAFVPLLIAEPGTEPCLRFWREADDVVTSRLTYVETGAALAQAVRSGRLTERARRRGMGKLDELWAEFGVVEFDHLLACRAVELAHQCALRGYDAVHCASAEQLAEDDVVAATGDRALLRAWAELGVATFDVATFDPNSPE